METVNSPLLTEALATFPMDILQPNDHVSQPQNRFASFRHCP